MYIGGGIGEAPIGLYQIGLGASDVSSTSEILLGETSTSTVTGLNAVFLSQLSGNSIEGVYGVFVPVSEISLSGTNSVSSTGNVNLASGIYIPGGLIGSSSIGGYPIGYGRESSLVPGNVYLIGGSLELASGSFYSQLSTDFSEVSTTSLSGDLSPRLSTTFSGSSTTSSSGNISSGTDFPLLGNVSLTGALPLGSIYTSISVSSTIGALGVSTFPPNVDLVSGTIDLSTGEFVINSSKLLSGSISFFSAGSISPSANLNLIGEELDSYVARLMSGTELLEGVLFDGVAGNPVVLVGAVLIPNSISSYNGTLLKWVTDRNMVGAKPTVSNVNGKLSIIVDTSSMIH